MKLKYYTKLKYLMFKSERKKVKDLIDLYKKYRSRLKITSDKGEDVTTQLVLKSILMRMEQKSDVKTIEINNRTLNYLIRKSNIW